MLKTRVLKRATASKTGQDIGRIPQWRLIVGRFGQNKLSVLGLSVLFLFYTLALFAEFVSPYPYHELDADYPLAPPTPVYFRDGRLVFNPLVSTLDKENFRFVYVPDAEHPVTVRLFARGFRYKLLGLFETDRHLLGPAVTPDDGSKPPKMLLWGADKQGRDMFSRVIHGGRISLSIGVLGVLISTVLGSVLGTASGYYGGWLDNAMQRVIEVIQTFPDVPLWMAIAAALPRNLPILQRFLFISVILSLIGWTGLARQVRGKVMGYRSADYTAAAKAAGASDLRIILTHLVPNSLSHIIIVAVLAIPGTIMAETALSFLGLGIMSPAVSLGLLLRDAQQIQVILTFPWLLLPAIPMVITMLCFNFLGDGLRDAADPYS